MSAHDETSRGIVRASFVRLRSRIHALATFLVVLLSFAYFAQGGGPNPNSRFDLTRALVEDRALVIDRFAQNTIDKADRDGHFYSDKAPGMSFAAAPAYALYYAARGAPTTRAEETNALWFLTVVVVGITSAAAAVAILSLLAALGVGDPWRTALVFAWCFGTNAFAYGTIFVAHQLVAALLALAFALLHRARDGDSRRRLARAALAGFLASWAAISEYPAAIVAAMLFFYGAVRVDRRALAAFVVAALPPLVLLGAYNRACFGAPWSLGYQHLSDPNFHAVIDRGFFGIGGPAPHAMLELTALEFRGLLPLSPFLALGAVGFVAMIRRRDVRAEGILCASASVFLALLNASYQRWDGGAGLGPRYFVPALPFVVVAAAFATRTFAALAPRAIRLAATTVFASSILYSVLVCTACVAVMPELPDAALPSPVEGMRPPDPRHPITTLVIPLLFEGHVAEKAVFARGSIGFSSLVKNHEDDAWNAGERLGLRGAATLIPLLILWAAYAALRAKGALDARRRGDKEEAPEIRGAPRTPA